MTLKMREFGTWLFFMVCALACTVYLAFFEHISDDYTYIAFLPLIFFICTGLFINVHTVILKNPGVLCLHGVMFIRLVVTPFLMTMSGYSSTFNGISQDNVIYAIGLMCYECITVYFVLACLVGSRKNKYIEPESEKSDDNLCFNTPGALFRILVLIMAVYCVIVWIVVPTCKDLYKTVLDFNEIDFTRADYSTSAEEAGTLSRSLQTLFKVLFDIVRIIVPMYLIISFKKWGVSPGLSVTVGILFAVAQLFFISDTTARAVMSAFLIVYFIARLYPKYAKSIAKTATALSLLVIVSYFVIRFYVGSRYGSEPIEYVSKILIAYFGGVDNVAVGANLPTGHEASTFWASLYSAIPFNSTLFGLKVEKLQTIYNTVNHSFGQIPPMIVEGAYYFGEAFAPVMSCLCAVGAYWYGEKYSNTKSPWHLISNLFMSVMLGISIVMFNEEIILMLLLEWLIPMRILSRLAERERKE